MHPEHHDTLVFEGFGRHPGIGAVRQALEFVEIDPVLTHDIFYLRGECCQIFPVGHHVVAVVEQQLAAPFQGIAHQARQGAGNFSGNKVVNQSENVDLITRAAGGKRGGENAPVGIVGEE
ncbi:MAG: hypothetical protein FE835_17480 [Gammaproteobacteria bacterium]|nr:hypothetical protein [Gammaproteobacteria bacterium]